MIFNSGFISFPHYSQHYLWSIIEHTAFPSLLIFSSSSQLAPGNKVNTRERWWWFLKAFINQSFVLFAIRREPWREWEAIKYLSKCERDPQSSVSLIIRCCCRLKVERLMRRNEKSSYETRPPTLYSKRFKSI